MNCMDIYRRLPIEQQTTLTIMCYAVGTTPYHFMRSFTVLLDRLWDLSKALIDAHVNDGLDIAALLESVQGETSREDLL